MLIARIFICAITVLSFTHTMTINAISEQKSKQQSTQMIVQEFDAYAKKAIEELNMPYVMYALVIDGNIVQTKCINNEKIKHREVNENTVMPISSVTKNMTGMLCAILYGKDMININQKITDFFPDIIIANEKLTKELTVKDLLCMSVGISDFSGNFFMFCGYPKETIIKTLAYASEKHQHVHKHFAYQNVTYGLLEDILEHQTRKSYSDLMHKYIFKAIGMCDSYVGNLKNRTSYFGNILFQIKNFTLNTRCYGFAKAISMLLGSFFGKYKPDIGDLYRIDGSNIQILQYSDVFAIFPATAGVATTIIDMAKYLKSITCNQTYDGDELMSDATYRLMLSDITEINNIDNSNFAFNKNRIQNASYGFGSMNLTYKGNHKIHGHYGGILGVTSSIWFDNDSKIGVAIICPAGGHKESTLAQKLSYKFLDLCYGFNDIDWIQKEKDHINMSKVFSKFGVINNSFNNQSDMHKYVGSYTYNGLINYVVKQTGNSLVCTDESQNISFKLNHALYNIFYYDKSDMVPQESKIKLVCKFNSNKMILEYEKGRTITLTKIK